MCLRPSSIKCTFDYPKTYMASSPEKFHTTWEHMHRQALLIRRKGSHKLIVLHDEKFRFLEGGTEVAQSREQYLQQIAQMEQYKVFCNTYMLEARE